MPPSEGTEPTMFLEKLCEVRASCYFLNTARRSPPLGAMYYPLRKSLRPAQIFRSAEFIPLQCPMATLWQILSRTFPDRDAKRTEVRAPFRFRLGRVADMARYQQICAA